MRISTDDHPSSYWPRPTELNKSLKKLERQRANCVRHPSFTFVYFGVVYFAFVYFSFVYFSFVYFSFVYCVDVNNKWEILNALPTCSFVITKGIRCNASLSRLLRHRRAQMETRLKKPWEIRRTTANLLRCLVFDHINYFKIADLYWLNHLCFLFIFLLWHNYLVLKPYMLMLPILCRHYQSSNFILPDFLFIF